MKKLISILFLGLVLCLPDLTFAQAKNIDCNDKPSTPASWTLESSQADGNYVFNPVEAANKVESFKDIKGSDMIKKLNGKGLNARVLDFLLENQANQALIPESWKEKIVVFTGSVFKDGGGNLCFKHLYWWDGKWQVGATYLDEAYNDRVAAVK